MAGSVIGAKGAGFEQTGADAKVRKLKMYGNPPDTQPVVTQDATGQTYVNPVGAADVAEQQPTSYTAWAKAQKAAQTAPQGTSTAQPAAGGQTATGNQGVTPPRAVAASPVAGAEAASQTMTAEGLGAAAARAALAGRTREPSPAPVKAPAAGTQAVQTAVPKSGDQPQQAAAPKGVTAVAAPKVGTASVSAPQQAAGTAAASAPKQTEAPAASAPQQAAEKAVAEKDEVSLPKAAPRQMSYQEMVDRYFANREDTPEERKRRKRETVINGISDMISALSNLYDTTRGAKSSWDPTKGLSARAQQRWKEMEAKANADKEARLRLYLQAAKGDDDYNRWLAQWKDHQNQQKLENKYRDKQDQRADAQLELTKDREKRDAELQPSRVRTANAQASEAETNAKYAPKLKEAQLDNTKASTAATRKRTSLIGMSGGSGGSGGGSHGGGSAAGYGDKAGRYALGNYTINGKLWDDDSFVRQLYNHLRGKVRSFKGSPGAKALFNDMDKKVNLSNLSAKEKADIYRAGIYELMTNKYDPGMQNIVGRAIEAFDGAHTGYQRPKGANTSQKQYSKDLFK